MKVKVQCTCGTRFEFEVEPVNERMPVPINCPGCNADATGLANAVIKQQLAAAQPTTPSAPAAPALKISGHTPAASSPTPSIPTAAPAPSNPSIPSLRIPGMPTQPSAAPAPTIPAQPAIPTATPAPAPAAAPAAPTPPAPSQGGLRISKPAVSHAAPAASATPTAAPAAANKCPKHPTEDPVETCRVCGKPMCLKCMEMFGYVCSVYCRNQANAKQMKIPVYAHQKSAVQAKESGKARLITYSVMAVLALLLGTWIWYAWFGSMPKKVYSVAFVKKQPRGYYKLIGPGQLLSIKDKQLSLFDVAHQKQLWATPLNTEASTPAPQPKPAGKTNGNNIKIRTSDPELMKAEAAAQIAKKQVPASDTSNNSSDDDEDFDFSTRDRFNIKEVIPTDTDIWILFQDRIAHYDRQTGSAKPDVGLKPRVVHVSHDDNGILAVSMPDKTHRVLTQISLPSGNVQTEEIDLSPSKAQPAGTTVANAKTSAASKTNKMTATVAKKPTTAITTQASAADALEDAFDFGFYNQDHYISAGANVAEMNVKLLEKKVEVHEAMKTKTKSILESGNMTAGQSLDASEELLNDMQRQNGGSKVTEDVSRYQVTVHRWLAKGTPDWTGEVIGQPSIYPLKTVDVIAGGKSIVVLDKNNKKLWDAKLTYPAEAHSSFYFDYSGGSSAPCVETGDALYFADQGMLTCFDLASGAPRWRLTSVGISKIQLDEKGNIYLTSTTASPDTIQYSKQVNLKNRPETVILKVDPKTGKKLWEVVKIGEQLLISGKYVYIGKVSTMMVALRLEDGPDYHYNFYRLDPSSGKIMWNYFQTKPGMSAEVNQNWIMIEFKDELQVLKFLSL
jgi:PQQ-like domain